MSNLKTIGYEGATVDDFIATLQASSVAVLIDVRDIPASRRIGFSKTALSRHLESVGIAYVHLPGLGNPKNGREAARQGQVYKFEKIFSEKLNTQEGQRDLAQAARIASEHVACLLCYERNPEFCHRNIVASELANILNINIDHLGVAEGLARNGEKRSRQRINTR